jgi:hypothetical protein
VDAGSSRAAALVAGILAALYLLLDPPSADMATQEYRVALFGTQGFALWDNGWYAGHHLPGYSVLFPPLGDLFGTRVAGALAAIAAAALGARLARDGLGPGRRAAAASLWFAAATATLLVTGRLTFALGLAVGLAALVVAVEGRSPARAAAAAALGFATALASPLPALFLALAAIAWGLARRDARAAWPAAGALLGVAALVVAFPEGGIEPFAASAFWPALGATVAVGIAAGPEARVLRTGCALYALALVASYLLDTPMGGNATRLGSLVAGPLLAGAVWGVVRGGPARLGAVGALAAALAYWQWFPPVRDWVRASGDPSVEEAFHAPLLARLQAERARRGPFRVEVPFTENHWEARWIAPRFALARGWQRQLDVERNPLFYDGRLTPARLRRWLDREAVAFVAVPRVDFDAAGQAEARLVTAGRVPGLRLVWRSRDWRLYAVGAARPLAAPGPAGASVTALDPDEIRLRARRPGDVRLAVRFTPYWRLAEGRGCVQQAPGDRTLLRLRAAGTVRLVTTFAPGRIRADGPRCA